MLIPYILLVASSLCLSVMAMMRKMYQENVGTRLEGTLWFSAISSFIAFGIGYFISGGFEFEPVVSLLASAYAFCCTSTAILLIVGTKFGSVSKTIMYATMGSLVLPAIFGLAFDPEDRLTLEKALGFLFAILTFFAGTPQRGNESGEKKGTWINITVFFTNGLALVVFKTKALLRPEFSQSAFVSEYMLIAATVSLILFAYLALRRKNGIGCVEIRKLLGRKALWPIVTYAVLFFLADYLAINCTSMIPLTVQAPLSFCLTILGTAMLEFVIYKQTFNKKDYVQMVFALLCSVCFVL